MARHILVPFDGSEPARDALEFALSDHPDAKITVLYVIDPVDVQRSAAVKGSALETDEIRTIRDEFDEQVLGDARERAAAHDVSIETEQLVGAVSSSIVEYAAEHGIDRIVMGSHGRTGMSRILLGSVAETVARRAPVPVTIVR